MPNRYLAAVTAVALLALAATPVGAHSDMEKPLYVAANGVDTGRCLDPAAPCRTIGYALARVGKGGQVRIAHGRYAVTDVADVFHLVSGVVDVRGGFQTEDDFREPTATASTLTGVPTQYRSALASRGFHVIADGKGLALDAGGIDGMDAGGIDGSRGIDAGGGDGIDAGGNEGIDAGGGDGIDAGGNEGIDAGGGDGIDAGGNEGIDAGGIDGIDAGGIDGIDAGGSDGKRRRRDFQGIDAGGGDGEKARDTRSMLEQYDRMQSALDAAPCVGGLAGGLPCDNTELLAHIPFDAVSARPGAAADVWGFVDLNTNREYAIVGYNIGTGVFDVTDPENPREVGFVDGQSAVWRDIKVHQNYDTDARRWQAYAYVTTDGSSDGLFVIDLTGLPHRVDRAAFTSDFSQAHNVYAVGTDFGTGLSLTDNAPSLIIAGSNNGQGRFRTYSLADAAAPAFVSIPAGNSNDYMHDAASMIVRDSRKDTQCVNATDYCEVLFDFNEDSVDIWDITIPSTPVRLSSTPYANSGYTHSGWPSEDGQFLFVHDELDEQSFGLPTTLRTFSLANLAAPAPVGGWNGPTSAIDHNGFVRGNRYYMSNYSRGLTILDISDPSSPQPVGRLDTYPFADTANFVGAWGAYPFLHSGNVAVSDTSSGLYVIGDRTLASSAGQLSFAQASYGGTEGDTLLLSVERLGGASGAVSVDIATIAGSSDDADVSTTTSTLSWSNGDATAKTVSITLAPDMEQEGLERRLLKLVAPTGGATLAPGSIASVYIGEPRDVAYAEFDRTEIEITERGFARAVVTVQRRGSTFGPLSASFALTGGDAIEGADFIALDGVTGTLDWADGDGDPKSIEFDIVDDGQTEVDEFFDLTLSGAAIGTAANVRVNIVAVLNQAPNAVPGASQTIGIGEIVTLDGTTSNDPEGAALTYRWTQTMGPTVALSGADSAIATFTSPDATSDVLLRFSLQVTDPDGLSDSSTVSVTVTTGNGGGGSFGWLLLLAAASAGWRRFTRRGAA